MSGIIIGTAGHIDHGKTCLIKALTGVDTDRLAEEKRRGITIDIGFAALDLPNGEKAGIIDVPGHEKYIHNMLAGAGGINIALLVVAADDGFMPQTREHLDILELLGVKLGLIAITKSELASPERLYSVANEIRNEVKGSFLEGALICETSSRTGIGIEPLRQTLFELAAMVTPMQSGGDFRLPIDRVFTIEGFGTVVTGTVLTGSVRAGDELMLYPSRKTVRVRGIQMHGSPTQEAFPRQRAALNLAAIKKSEVKRGETLASVGTLPTVLLLDVKLTVLKNAQQGVKNGSVIHFYHYTGTTLCKVVLAKCKLLLPGQSATAQLRFKAPVSAKIGDNFIARFYSPMFTLGGGVIINADAKKPQRAKQAQGDALVTPPTPLPAVEKLCAKIILIYTNAGLRPPTNSEVKAACAAPPALYKQAVNQLFKDKRLVAIAPQLCLSRTCYDDALAKLCAHFALNEEGSLAQLRNVLGTSRKYAQVFLEHCDNKKITRRYGDVRRMT